MHGTSVGQKRDRRKTDADRRRLGLLLGRFLLAHPEKADQSRRRIACVGDSITFGAGVLPTRKTDAWPVLLEDLLGRDFQVLNYGVSGATLQKEGDFPYRKIGFLKRLEKVSPDMILLMLGTNDSKPYNWNETRFGKEYEELIKELLSGWSGRLILMVPPKAFPEERTGIVAFDISNDVIRDSIRSLILSLAERYQLPAIDLYAFTEDHPQWFDDGVHPNKAGNRAIAEYIHSSLKP